MKTPGTYWLIMVGHVGIKFSATIHYSDSLERVISRVRPDIGGLTNGYKNYGQNRPF